MLTVRPGLIAEDSANSWQGIRTASDSSLSADRRRREWPGDAEACSGQNGQSNVANAADKNEHALTIGAECRGARGGVFVNTAPGTCTAPLVPSLSAPLTAPLSAGDRGNRRFAVASEGLTLPTKYACISATRLKVILQPKTHSKTSLLRFRGTFAAVLLVASGLCAPKLICLCRASYW